MTEGERLIRLVEADTQTSLPDWQTRMIAASAHDVLAPRDAVALAAACAERAAANVTPGAKTITVDVGRLVELSHGYGPAAADARRALLEIGRLADREATR